jgi:PIN domain nuclease of toxin-antitoxin system
VHESGGLGVSAISCWEIAKLVQLKRIVLPLPTVAWLDEALSYPNVRLLPLTPAIAADATALPGIFHKDPADQIIVATARIHSVSLLTADQKIRAYPHVQTL